MKLETKTIKETETLESYFDEHFNSSELGAEILELPKDYREFIDNLIQVPGDSYLITCRLPNHSYLSECEVLLKIFLYIWLNPIYLEVYFGLDKWWEPALIEILGQKKVCSVWKVRTFENTSIKSMAFTIPKAIPISKIDCFNVLNEDIIKARFSAALQELNIY